jgi:hypothetical protein
MQESRQTHPPAEPLQKHVLRADFGTYTHNLLSFQENTSFFPVLF